MTMRSNADFPGEPQQRDDVDRVRLATVGENWSSFVRVRGSRGTFVNDRAQGPEPHSSAPGPAPEVSDRLSSWKEIAAYLGRDVRTVQRWERTQGLPVHRHRHSRLSTAYAYKSELDAWWHNQTPPESAGQAANAGLRNASHADDTDAATSEHPHSVPDRADKRSTTFARPGHVTIGASLAITIIVAMLVWPVARNADSLAGSATTLVADDWVLMTAFDNHTGEPVWTGTLDYVLRQQLSASRFVRIASTDRVRDALQLMRRPLDTRVDVAVGREISLRDGAIRILVAGRLDKVGGRYSLSLDLVSPTDGRIVATNRRTVDRQDHVLDTLSDQAEWIRQALGEHMPDTPAPQRLERVSTASLDALQLYSQAMELGMQFKWAPAVKLLEAAVAHDPAFASAHILLAHAMSHTGQPWTAVLEHARRARGYSDAVDEVERYFIEGSVLTFEANTNRELNQVRLAEAAAAYEALLRVDPYHYWASNNLMYAYERLGRFDLAVPLAVARGRERPNDVRTQVMAAVALTAWQGEPEAARPFIERARGLVDSGVPLEPQALAWVTLFDVHVAWVRGDAARARQLLDAQAARLSSMAGDELEHFAGRVGKMYLGLGRCRDARAALERVGIEFRHEYLAFAALQCDDQQAFVEHMLADERTDQAPSYGRIMWGARTRRFADVERWQDDFRRRFANRLTLIVGEGELAAERGDWTHAIERFELAWTTVRGRGQDRTPMIAERLAEGYLRTGRPARALEVLEATIPLRTKMCELIGLPGPLAWIRAQVTLARLYRELGRPDEAARRLSEIRPLLAEADPDLPLLRDLDSRPAVAVRAPSRNQ